MANRIDQIQKLKEALEALESQRSFLGDTAVDLSVKALREEIAALEASAPTVFQSEGERSQATILFSDLSGDTLMNEKLDPEKVQELMNRIKTNSIRIVEKYEGIINQFVGDEIVVLFGIPRAHEDDPIRALKVALELHEFVEQMNDEVVALTGKPVYLHSSINTGLIVTEKRDERDGKFSLTGDTVNTGSRLLDLAKENEILISPETQVFIAPYFKTESLNPVLMKGKEQPIVPYRLVGKTMIQSRIEAAKQSGFTPFIERESELATLHSCLQKTIHGKGQFVTIRGDAGLGKSRLLYEFRHKVDREKITVLQGHCQSYGTSTPYLPFQDALRRGLHLNEEDSIEELHRKAVQNLLNIDPALINHIPTFLHLLSIPSQLFPLPVGLSGEQLKLSIQEALVDINTLNTWDQPMVLIFEDWHWVDEGSESALLKHLEVMDSFPLMLILVYRPEYEPKWTEEDFHTPIDLSSVQKESMESMINAIYGVEQLPPKFADQIFKLSGGNPFFIEELCSLLAEEGSVLIKDGHLNLNKAMEQITFPETVQAVIRAKLDRLDPDSREAIRLASVIGREFRQNILEKITSHKDTLVSALESLARMDFIRQITQDSEQSYQFNHVITQEVTYQTLLLKQRTSLHRQVAETIESLYQERLEGQYEALAFHYNKSESWEKALHYLELAGDKAARNFSLLDARTYYKEAILLMDTHPRKDAKKLNRQKAKRIDISLKWAELSHYAGPQETIVVLDTSLDYAREMKNESKTAHLNYWLAQRNIVTGNLKKATTHFYNCIELAEKVGEKNLHAQACAALGRIHFFEAEYLKAKDFLEQGVPVLDQLGERDDVAYAKGFLCGCYAYTGDFEKAFKYGEEAVNIAKEIGNLSRVAASSVLLGACFERQGKWDRGVEISNKTIGIARSLGEVMSLCFGMFLLGYCLFMKRKQEEGLSKMLKAVNLMESSKIYHLFPLFYGYLSYVYAKRSMMEEAKETAGKCLKWAPSYKGFVGIAYITMGMADAKKENSSSPEVDQTMEKAMRLSEEQGQKPLHAQACFEYAKILCERGEVQKAKAYLNKAMDLFKAMKMSWWLLQARTLQIHFGV